MNAMNATKKREIEGSVQCPPLSTTHSESPDRTERRARPVGNLGQSSMSPEEVRRYVRLTTPGASFDPMGNAPRVLGHNKYQRVEQVALAAAEPDYGYDFEYNLGPWQIRELREKVEAWLLDPEFVREREFTKEWCLGSDAPGRRGQLPSSSVGRGMPEIYTGRPVIAAIGRRTRVTNVRVRQRHG